MNKHKLTDFDAAAQVAMMGDIYSKASRVVIYIGEEFEDSQLAIDTINHVSENKWKHFDGPAETVLRIRGVPFVFGGVPWDSIYRFFETPW